MTASEVASGMPGAISGTWYLTFGGDPASSPKSSGQLAVVIRIHMRDTQIFGSLPLVTRSDDSYHPYIFCLEIRGTKRGFFVILFLIQPGYRDCRCCVASHLRQSEYPNTPVTEEEAVLASSCDSARYESSHHTMTVASRHH